MKTPIDKLPGRPASIQWDDDRATASESVATIRHDDGREATIRQVNHRSQALVYNGPFATGRTVYLVGDAEYDTFDAAFNAAFP